ncbi:hypothetical protein D3C83_221440 [compost metagenome]
MLDPPYPGRQQLAFVNKKSEAYATFQTVTASGNIFTPILDVAKRTTPEGKGYLEILRIVETDWLPKEKSSPIE